MGKSLTMLAVQLSPRNIRNKSLTSRSSEGLSLNGQFLRSSRKRGIRESFREGSFDERASMGELRVQGRYRRH